MTQRQIDKAVKRDAFACGDCGYAAAKWFGRCPDCGGWSTAARPQPGGAERVRVASLLGQDAAPGRWSTRMAEVDRVLGGGIVPGAVILLAGEPGIGKSTLVLQLMDALIADRHSCLLITGEESIGQVALRAGRLGVARDRLRVAASTSLRDVLAAAEAENAQVIVVDSIQTLEDPDLDQGPGSVVQVRECAASLVGFAKRSGTAIVLVGHVTKEGSLAGPKTLEHVVDAVATLEGERTGTLRLLRATKNRFGSCEETGVFVMSERGLQPVEDASAMLLADRQPGVSGSVVFPSLEGTRPVLVEIQALLAENKVPQPRRVAIGVEARRLSLLLGVLTQRARIPFGDMDVFVAAAGGIAVREPAADLALCLSLYSAAHDVPLDEGLVAIGEVGLAGEIRRVPGTTRRLSEAARLGFTKAIVPPGVEPGPMKIEIMTANNLAVAVSLARRARVACPA